MKKSASQKRITTRKPNETLAHFQDRVGVPTIGDRVKRAMHSLTQMAPAGLDALAPDSDQANRLKRTA